MTEKLKSRGMLIKVFKNQQKLCIHTSQSGQEFLLVLLEPQIGNSGIAVEPCFVKQGFLKLSYSKKHLTRFWDLYFMKQSSTAIPKLPIWDDLRPLIYKQFGLKRNASVYKKQLVGILRSSCKKRKLSWFLSCKKRAFYQKY